MTTQDTLLSKTADGSALVDQIAARIRAQILSGEIPIGAQLRQAELASAFGVSRTPVREALRQLQSGGLIHVQPNRGAVVRVPAPWEVRQAYEVRAELESLAAARAVTRLNKEQLETLREANRFMYERSVAESQSGADGEGATPGQDSRQGNDLFHTLIVDAAGNPHLAKVISEINDTFPRNVSALLLVNDSRHRDMNFAEHEQIIEALAAGDARKARKAMHDHVIAAGDQLAQWYERRSSTVFLG